MPDTLIVNARLVNEGRNSTPTQDLPARVSPKSAAGCPNATARP